MEEATIAISVPQAYKEYLWPRHQFVDLKNLTTQIIPYLLIFALWRWGGHKSAYFHVIIVGLPLIPSIMIGWLLWMRQRRKPWHYVINDKRIELIEWRYGSRLWNWHWLNWTREVIGSIEETEWRGLPMLLISTVANDPKGNREYHLVYAQEDAEKVQNELLPLLAQCRQNYRHDFWAERWASK